MCSIDSNIDLSLNSTESLDSAKKHYSVSMLIRLKISLSLNNAVSLNSAAINIYTMQLFIQLHLFHHLFYLLTQIINQI